MKKTANWKWWLLCGALMLGNCMGTCTTWALARPIIKCECVAPETFSQ